jgi:3-oxoadipate CoA-transferase beta subunit
MDLATGAKAVFVMMTLFAKDGSPKLVPACTYPRTGLACPLSGLACVSRVYTAHAIFYITPDAVVVTETFGITVANIATRLEVAVRRVQH